MPESRSSGWNAKIAAERSAPTSRRTLRGIRAKDQGTRAAICASAHAPSRAMPAASTACCAVRGHRSRRSGVICVRNQPRADLVLQLERSSRHGTAQRWHSDSSCTCVHSSAGRTNRTADFADAGRVQGMSARPRCAVPRPSRISSVSRTSSAWCAKSTAVAPASVAHRSSAASRSRLALAAMPLRPLVGCTWTT